MLSLVFNSDDIRTLCLTTYVNNMNTLLIVVCETTVMLDVHSTLFENKSLNLGIVCVYKHVRVIISGIFITYQILVTVNLLQTFNANKMFAMNRNLLCI